MGEVVSLTRNDGMLPMAQRSFVHGQSEAMVILSILNRDLKIRDNVHKVADEDTHQPCGQRP